MTTEDDLVAAMRRCVEKLHGDDPVFGCVHLLRDRLQGGSMCLNHPTSGLLCVACQGLHQQRHGTDLDAGCDRCHKAGPLNAEPLFVKARAPVAGVGPVVGVAAPGFLVTVVGIFLCRRCAKRWDRTAWSLA